MGARSFFSLLWPERCVLCGTSCHNWVCVACEQDQPRRHPRCPRCATPTTFGHPCRLCRLATPAFDKTLAAFHYDFPIDKLIHQLKYTERLSLADYFSHSLLQLDLPTSQIDGLVPVPMHPKRLVERGFNQSLEIARRLSRSTGIALMNDCLRRVKHTESQAGLTFRHRRENLRDAFSCPAPLTGLRLALVDDVMTSGSTLRECALTLKRSGARQVHCWVVARAGKKKFLRKASGGY